ncbi:Uncharacterised protein [Mesomycoplasma conjunctivae]|uniref:Uncharacterized protein n=1 Tax=Mesomycoplasma conjunctivae (strain ATCC 25834 / NCTC 10147 / HRC/581) TaxID=572263 RepID=C5J6M2_MESCH|nr:hypothetical protein [Mesomycoplasma conjunctivae]CAT05123.1 HYPOTHETICAL PROTEIN MCJ_004280 [Mesomycoplasma conjunctivae]VEU66365.1 Uncharacterised protein [Mesomycoplasma conjunctivae]
MIHFFYNKNDQKINVIFNNNNDFANQNIELEIVDFEDQNQIIKARLDSFDSTFQTYKFNANLENNKKYILKKVTNLTTNQNFDENYIFVVHDNAINITNFQQLESDDLTKIKGSFELNGGNDLFESDDQIELTFANDNGDAKVVSRPINRNNQFLVNFALPAKINQEFFLKEIKVIKSEKPIDNSDSIIWKSTENSNLIVNNKIIINNYWIDKENNFIFDIDYKHLDLSKAQVKASYLEGDSTAELETEDTNFEAKLKLITNKKNANLVAKKLHIRDNFSNTISIDIDNNLRIVNDVSVVQNIYKTTLNNNNLKLGLELINPINLNSNLKIKLVNQNDESEFFESKSFLQNDSKIDFQFDNIPSNRLLKIDGFNPQDSKIILAKSLNNNIELPYQNFDINLDDNLNTSEITSNSAKLKISFTSKESVFSENQQIIAIFKSKTNNSDQKSAQAQVLLTKNNQKWELDFQLNNLDSKTEYYLETLAFANKPQKAWKDYQVGATLHSFFENKDATKFKFETQNNLLGFNIDDFSEKPFTKNRSLKINFINDNDLTKYQNKKIKLIFKDGQNDQASTSEIAIQQGQREYKTTIDLNHENKVYSLSEIKIIDSGSQPSQQVDQEQSFSIVARNILKDSKVIYTNDSFNNTKISIPFVDVANSINVNEWTEIKLSTEQNPGQGRLYTGYVVEKEGKKYLEFEILDIDINQKYHINYVGIVKENNLNFFEKTQINFPDSFSFQNDFKLVNNSNYDSQKGTISFNIKSDFDLIKLKNGLNIKYQIDDKHVNFFANQIEIKKTPQVTNFSQDSSTTSNNIYEVIAKFSSDQVKNLKTAKYKLVDFYWQDKTKNKLPSTTKNKFELDLSNFTSEHTFEDLFDLKEKINKVWKDFWRINNWKMAADIKDEKLNEYLKTNFKFPVNAEIQVKNLFQGILEPKYQISYMGNSFDLKANPLQFNFVNLNADPNASKIWGFGSTTASWYWGKRYAPSDVLRKNNDYWYKDNPGPGKTVDFHLIPQNVRSFPYGVYVHQLEFQFFKDGRYVPFERKDWWKKYITITYTNINDEEKTITGEHQSTPFTNSDRVVYRMNIKDRVKRIKISFDTSLGNQWISIFKLNFLGFARNKDFPKD